MNQGKLEVVKQEVAGVNISILGISELKWNTNLPIMVGFTSNQPPSLIQSENYLISIIKYTFVTLIILENPRVLGACARNRDED